MIPVMLIRRLGPVRAALLRQGRIRELILMSSDLSVFEKAMLMRYIRGGR